MPTPPPHDVTASGIDIGPVAPTPADPGTGDTQATVVGVSGSLIGEHYPG